VAFGRDVFTIVFFGRALANFESFSSEIATRKTKMLLQYNIVFRIRDSSLRTDRGNNNNITIVANAVKRCSRHAPTHR